LEVPKFNQHIFFASVQLASLSGALELASKCVAKELAAIDECLEDGTAPEDFDYESAADDPIALSQLTSRAVAYELVAIVEDRLNALAEVPWKASRADSVPAAPLFSNEWAEALAKEKPVSKESFKKRRTLVETHYGFDFKNLDGWQEHDELRTTVNLLKHRRGSREWKDVLGTPDWKKKNLLEREDMDEEKARQAIKDVTRFLMALENAIVHWLDTNNPGAVEPFPVRHNALYVVVNRLQCNSRIRTTTDCGSSRHWIEVKGSAESRKSNGLAVPVSTTRFHCPAVPSWISKERASQ
jgi:hypothetical protein